MARVREFIRAGASLTCYLRTKRTVLVEQRPPEESLVGFPAVMIRARASTTSCEGPARA